MKRHLALFCLAALTACGPSGGQADDDDTADGGAVDDADHDDFTTEEGDCDDSDPDVNPDADDDTCDNKDNDCNGVIDDAFNADHDTATSCNGDCDDSNPQRYPGATELPNDIDDDCDGIVDNHTDSYDDDGDGYSEEMGDCNDEEKLIGPESVEVATTLDDGGNEIPEGIDNDCDGVTDEALEPCDTGLNRTVDTDYPKAMELCDWVQGTQFVQSPDPSARNILPDFGTYQPHAGASVVTLSTGRAVDAAGPGYVNPGGIGGGTGFSNSAPHPLPQPDPGDGCGSADPPTVQDYTELKYTIKVPPNASSLAFDFNFMSGEFPQFVCSPFDDTFLAILSSTSFNGNISFDEQMRPVTINIGFFDVCQPAQGPNCVSNAELSTSGFEAYGGTGWLHTVAPVTGGETITLRFTLHDEGDNVLDSLVLMDNFSWGVEPVDGPVTIPRELAPGLHRQLRERMLARE